MKFIPHSSSTLGPAEATALRDVVEHNFAGHGPRTAELENRFRQRTGRRHAFALPSGHRALSLAVRALGLPPKSSVALPVLTCPTVAASIREAGHQCSLCDIDLDLTMAPSALSDDVAAMIAPHAYGAPVDVVALATLGVPWIEDCATSPANQIHGRPAGASGTLAIFSFGSTKYLTGGAGGMLVTDDDEFAARVTELLDFEMPERLPDLNAAVALVQLDRLDEFVARRRAVANLYEQGLAGNPHIRRLPSQAGHTFYRYIVGTAVPAAPLAAHLRNSGIDARTAVNPWLDTPRFSGVSGRTGSFPVADSWREHLLSLPIYPSLTDEDAARVVQGLKDYHAR
jgi:dTDP-4-amino-4,6-dideoxygalactose transaminase